MEKSLQSLLGYALGVNPAVDEVYVEATSVRASFIGGSSYRVQGTIPAGELQGRRDGKPSFPLSDSTAEAIKPLNQSGYDMVIDPKTNALPVVYCIKSPETQYVDAERPDGTTVSLYGKSPIPGALPA